jgi:HSP20 family protein
MRTFLDEVLDELRKPNTTADANTPVIVPLNSISESDTQYILSVELPGVIKSDIDIDSNEKTITITAKKPLPVLEGVDIHSSSIEYGIYMKKYNLRATLDMNNIEATFENAILTLVLPKHEDVKPKKINIK